VSMCPWLSSLLHDQPCTGRTTISSSRLPSHTSHGVREKLTKLEPERDGELGLPSARWRVASSQCKQPQRNTKRRRTHRSRKLPTAANFRNTPESSGGAASRIAGGRVWRLSVADDDDEDDDVMGRPDRGGPNNSGDKAADVVEAQAVDDGVRGELGELR